MRLNLGHTLGHAVEALSNYEISHGKAVSIGMALITRSAAQAGICDCKTRNRILSLLEQFQLPCSAAYSPDQLFAAACTDKKRSGGTIRLVVPQAIGSCSIRPTPISELQSFIEAGF